jgi:hypothetical protein
MSALELGSSVGAQQQRMLRRIELQNNDVFRFLGEPGSMLIWKASARCGFSPWACQISRPLASLMSTACTSDDARGSVGGVGRRLMRGHRPARLVRRVEIVGLASRPVRAFCNPATSSDTRENFFGVIVMWAAISLSDWPRPQIARRERASPLAP